MSYCWPLDASVPVTQAFGSSPGGYNPPGGHTGIDFGANSGTPVRASGDGVIVFAGQSYDTTGASNAFWLVPYGGNIIALDCGATAPTFTYSHLSRISVTNGQRVKKGDIIGYTGNTGTATTGPHLHFEALPPGYILNGPTYGRVAPSKYCTSYWQGAATPLAANERLSGNFVAKQRSAPKIADNNVVREIQPNSREVFKGYVRGESVTANGQKSDLWYQDQHGYVSVTLFTPFSVAGLPDLTPKPAGDPVGKTQRVTGKDGAQGRKAADKNAAAVGERFAADKILSFKGYVKADTPPYPGTSNVWFVSISGWYFWSGVFVDQGTHDLPDLTPKKTAPVPAPAPVAPYSFKADIAVINGITVEAIPAAASNVEVGNFPAKPVSAVDHHWGTPPVSIESVINEFKKTGTFKSANYVVTDTRIVQMVRLGDRPYHAGAQGNVFVGVEIDPRGYEQDAAGKYTATALKIQANVRALHKALNVKYGYTLTQVLHKDVPGNATSCSPFDLAVLRPEAPAASVPAPKPAPEAPAPTPSVPAPVVPPAVCEAPAETPVEKIRETLEEFTDHLIDGFLNRPKK